MHAPFDELCSTANDDRMRSLIEASRETGIPMPVILRLQREHPDELPSVRVGSAHFFPEGALPLLRSLAAAEGARSGAPEAGARGLISLSRRRRGLRRPAPPASTQEPTAGHPSPTLAEPSAKAGRSPRASADRAPGSASYPEIAGRLAALEAQQREITAELTHLIHRLQTPRVVPSRTA